MKTSPIKKLKGIYYTSRQKFLSVFNKITLIIKSNYKYLKTLIKSGPAIILYKYLAELVYNIFLYGIVLSFILSQFTSYPFNVSMVIACGLLFYMVRDEFPPIIRDCYYAFRPPQID